MNYRKINNLMGWLTGAIAYIVYLLTMEPTASFWDCGEFASCAYKVEVGHSPGAPFFMLVQRFFSLFTEGAMTAQPSTKAVVLINSFSALTSALTILFLFWTITHLAKKLLVKDKDEPDGRNIALIMGAGLVGALAYTFSDTFWFSAVEAEVYATSSFFTAFVFWAIMKWENIADKRYSDRWLVLICYMMGLSVGVHLLNLLTIPALAMVYYFKRYKPTTSGAIGAFLIGCVFLALVQFGILQGIPILASKFDLMFVNGFGLPFDTGAVFLIILIIALLAWLLFWAKKKGHYLLHTGTLCIIFVVIGFSSYLAAIIRSRADVPIDMTNPDNAMSLTSYISRDQFGQQPLLFGPDFNTPLVQSQPYVQKGVTYAKSEKNGKNFYEAVGKKIEPNFDGGRFFPRIWDNNDPSHVQFYRNYLGLGPNDDPSSADNFSFFFRYQLNWMWWRYFMWNYVGRENDVEGQGDARAGNWISGIKPIDQFFGRGDIDKMGDGMSNNKARNELFFLPFILGICGLVYQFNRNRKDGIIVFLLFFFTGIAVVLYLNNTPLQPRERDYAYAGSTYAYAIWIGLGVLMVAEWMQRIVKGASSAYLATGLCLLTVPVLMAAKEWDDHDRSKKYLARDSAYNVLMSCEPNAILFTFGDNDTYPLWYMQEIEGVRSDVRIVNLSLLGIDWYIDQLNYKINKADAVPMMWQKQHYVGDRRNYLRVMPNPQIPQNQFINLTDICKFMISDDPNSKIQVSAEESQNYIPTKNFYAPTLSKADLVKNGMAKAEDTARIINEMKFTLGKDYADKSDLCVLNIVAAIAQQGWNRPIYFGGGLPGDNYQGMQDYLKMEGMVYRLVPYKVVDSNAAASAQRGEMGFVDAEKSFNLFTKTYRWGGGERNDVYFDEKNKIMFTSYRNNVSRIASELSKMNRQKDAEAVIDVVDKNITQSSYAYNPYLLQGFDPSAYFMAGGCYQIGYTKKGREITMKLVKNLEADVQWILTLKEDARESMAGDVQRDISIMSMLGNMAKGAGDNATAAELEQKVTMLAKVVSSKINMQAFQQQQGQ